MKRLIVLIVVTGCASLAWAGPAQPKQFFKSDYATGSEKDVTKRDALVPEAELGVADPDSGPKESLTDSTSSSVVEGDPKENWIVEPETPEAPEKPEMKVITKVGEKEEEKKGDRAKESHRPSKAIPLEERARIMKERAEAKQRKEAKRKEKERLKRERAEAKGRRVTPDPKEFLEKNFLAIETVEMIVSTKDEREMIWAMKEFADFIEKHNFKEPVINLVGKLSIRADMPDDWQRVVDHGGRIGTRWQNLRNYGITRSPAWVVSTEEGKIILEATKSIDEYVTPTGMFPRAVLEEWK